LLFFCFCWVVGCVCVFFLCVVVYFPFVVIDRCCRFVGLSMCVCVFHVVFVVRCLMVVFVFLNIRFGLPLFVVSVFGIVNVVF
jgi:hypothetical protein